MVGSDAITRTNVYSAHAVRYRGPRPRLPDAEPRVPTELVRTAAPVWPAMIRRFRGNT